MIPGEYKLAAGDIIANEGRREIELEVANTGDRPIQVGSHFHFFEVNRALRFDRAAAFGMRLNIPAGTAVRFEPGDTKKVLLVEIGGSGKRLWPEWFDKWTCKRIHETGSAETRCSIKALKIRVPEGLNAHESENSTPAIRRPVRTDHRRSRAPRRHRPVH